MDLVHGKKVEQKQIDFEPTPEPVEPTPEPTEVEPTEPVQTEPQAEVTEPTATTEETLGVKPEEQKSVQVPVTESDEYKKLQAEYEKLRTDKEALDVLLNEADPMQYFANEAEYKKQQIIKNNPDVDRSVLDTLFGTDLKEMSPVDILIHDYMARTGERDVGEIKEYVHSKYDFDPESGKIPFGLKADANEARKRLDKIINQEVTVPKNVRDVLEQKQEEIKSKVEQTKATFRPIAEKLAEEMRDISEGMGKDALHYEYEPEFKKQIPDLAMGVLISEGVSLDNAEQKLSDVKRVIREVYILNNFDKIVKAHVDEAVSAKDNEWRAKVHNPSPPNTQTAPETESKDTTPEQAIGLIKGKK